MSNWDWLYYIWLRRPLRNFGETAAGGVLTCLPFCGAVALFFLWAAWIGDGEEDQRNPPA